MILGIFLTYKNKQKDYSTGKEAQKLADSIAKIAFSTDKETTSTIELPKTIGNSRYELNIENNNFAIKIITGSQKGKTYKTNVGTELKKISVPQPGEKLYTRWDKNKISVSSNPIKIGENLELEEIHKPPAFYDFAKNKPREAAALISSYHYVKRRYPRKENLDIKNYKWESENILKTKITSNGTLLTTLKIYGKENRKNIEHIKNSWFIEKYKIVESNLSFSEDCPSVRKAYLSNWFIKPEEVRSHFTGRTWKIKDENKILRIENINLKAATVTTKISRYPTWRVDLNSKDNPITAYLSMVFWKVNENQPCFVFESSPTLEAEI